MSYIMVVDDDPDLADATATALKADGHEVLIHLDIDKAFESFRNRRPDLMVLDVMFPDNSSGGFDLARKIAAETKDVPILMLTAVNAHFQLDFSAGDIDQEWMPVTDFMEKPVNFEELRKKVVDLIVKKKQQNAKK
ncbi:MAG: response regulator [Chitinivibrionales bacterium]|nr:response regulator [Chitinivibrionales bacterium]